MHDVQEKLDGRSRIRRAASFSLPPFLFVVALIGSACATVPPVPEPPVITWEEKLRWIIRLEDQRIIRDPNPPPPVVLAPATRRQPAVVAPPPPSDLIRLLGDGEARVRRRAALALGRVGLAEAVEPLTALLPDPEVEVRQMAAFALGLIGDPAARPALTTALQDASPMVQGRAAEALGMIGDDADAPAVSAMVRAHVAAGALAGIAPDDLTYPLPAPVEAVRLGLYALARFGAWDALAAAALNQNGEPASTWWPIAYALQRIGDPGTTQSLITLLKTPGRFTAAFAARGLGALRAETAAAPLRQIIEASTVDSAVRLQAIRALAAIDDAAAAPVLTRLIADVEGDPTLRLEALSALGAVGTADSIDLLLDLVSDPLPPVRGAAMRALAQIDADTFLATLSGLDADRDWTVRAAQAAALGLLPPERGVPRLMLMLQERDRRLIPAVLAALVAAKAPDAERILVEHLTAEDFAIRAAAARMLGELKIAMAVPALVQAYHATEGDTTYVAKAAILAALNQIDPATARPLLQQAVKDREWALRVRAATLLEEQGVEGQMAAIRPATSGRRLEEAEWQWLLEPAFSPHAYIETDRGMFEVELAILDAPLTVANFIALARKGFFDGVAVHRVVPDFVIQDGDPRGDGEGGPGYTIRDEINQRPYLRGTLGMALDGEDTGGSQFFVTHSPQPHLDGRYTVFGHVVAGMDVVDRIQQRDVVRRVRIWDGTTEFDNSPLPPPRPEPADSAPPPSAP